MSYELPTVRVAASDPDQGLFVLINEADFDPAVHTRYDGPDPVAEPAPEPAAEAEAEPSKRSGRRAAEEPAAEG